MNEIEFPEYGSEEYSKRLRESSILTLYYDLGEAVVKENGKEASEEMLKAFKEAKKDE